MCLLVYFYILVRIPTSVHCNDMTYTMLSYYLFNKGLERQTKYNVIVYRNHIRIIKRGGKVLCTINRTTLMYKLSRFVRFEVK